MKLSQILAILGDCWMEMMQLYYGSGCRPHLIPSLIHNGHIKRVVAPFDEVCRRINAPLHNYTTEAGSDFWHLGDWWVGMMPWCYGWGCRPTLIASHIHIGHMYSVLAPFNEVYRHISGPLHCYTDKAGSDFGNSGWLLNGNDAMIYGWSCRPPLIASHIHIGHIWSVLAPFIEVRRHISASINCYTTDSGCNFEFRVTFLWKWCYDVIV